MLLDKIYYQKLKSKILNNTNVRTIHSICGTIYNKYNKKKNGTSLQSIITRTNTILENINIIPETLSKIKAIFIDEAQDIDGEQNRFLNILMNKFNISIIMVGDPNQCIYGFRYSSSNYLINVSKKIYLEHNYRSTIQIINLCKKLMNHPTKMLSLKNGKKPYLFCGDKEDSFTKIFDIIKSNIDEKTQELKKSIAIISPVKIGSNCYITISWGN